MEFYVGPDAASRLAAYCHDVSGTLVVADPDTWTAGGAAVVGRLGAAGLPVRRFVYPGRAPLADEASVFALISALRESDRLLVAAGSGTVTDLVRFVCAKAGKRFVSFPTAPSVDAYASSVAPLVLDGVKRTLPGIPPEAIFADIDILRSAPREMIAAGFGDMVAKYTAVADWKLGSLLWDEPYDESVALASLESAALVCEAAPSIGRGETEGIATLVGGLVESGILMSRMGHSRSASGTEHHCSHFWEMRLFRDGRPPLLHGHKVGVATIMAAEMWKRIALMRSDKAAGMLQARPAILRRDEEAVIAAAYGAEAPGIVAEQERFLSLGEQMPESFRRKVIERWAGVRRIAASVPEPATIGGMLAAAGCPTDPRDLGLGGDDVAAARSAAHWLRDRFTVRKLLWLLEGA